MVISRKRKKIRRGLFIIEDWVLMEMKQKHFVFHKSFNSIQPKFVILMFLSYFHYWILILKLNMSRFEWIFFISISFMICFNPNLDQNIGLWILYLPRKLPASSILDIPLPHNSIFQLTSHCLLGFSSS
jgi:hypothetical protein